MGMFMQMGLGGAGGGAYQGPVYGSDGPAAVPATMGYADTAASAMTFGPGGVQGAGRPQVHCLMFGVVCFAALVFLGWALPR